MSDVPDNLHPMQYGTHILEEVLGWPSKGNAEMMADCISSIAKAKKFTHKQAYVYLTRAIRLAKEQGIAVDRFFFQGGDYMNIRKNAVSAAMKLYEPIDWEKTRQEQDTPEFKAASERARTLLARIAGRKAFP